MIEQRRAGSPDKPPADRCLLLLLMGIAAFHVLTMPKFYYPGDNFAPRTEVANWLMTGRLGLDYSKRAELGGFLEQRGQYLFENDRKRRFFSKYGIGYDLFYVPPLFAEKLLRGRVDTLKGTTSMLVLINIYQILLTLGIAIYLYRLVGLYTERTWLKVVFLLASFYATFLWHYLRSPTLEIYQILPFVGFYYHMMRFFRARARGADDSVWTWLHLSAATGFVGMLIWMKAFHGLLLIAVWLFAFLAGPDSRSMMDRIKRNLLEQKVRHAIYLLVPSVVIVIVLLGTNWYRFDSPTEMGYGQWQRDGKSTTYFSLEFVPGALHGFFLRKGNANIFLHYPLLLFALFGFLKFFRKYRVETLFLSFVFLTNLAALLPLSYWSGSWCYGPRYLLMITVVASVPVIETWNLLWTSRTVIVKAAGVCAMAAALAWSVTMQVNVNSLHYFAYNYLEGLFSQFKQERITQYFYCYHFGNIYGDLIAYRLGRAEFYPLKVVEEVVPPNQQVVVQRLRAYVLEFAKPNYLFFD